jgi:hypothetical protein
MASPDPAQEAAELLHGAASLPREARALPGETALRDGAGAPEPGALDELVRLAATGVSGCSGASATLWRNGEPAVFAASHPDLAELATIEQACGSGPVTASVAGGVPVWSPDTLDEDRWPAYAAAALARGLRCSLTLMYRSGSVTVTLSLFGARAGQPCPQDQPLARLAAVFGGAAPRHPAGLAVQPPGPIGS